MTTDFEIAATALVIAADADLALDQLRQPGGANRPTLANAIRRILANARNIQDAIHVRMETGYYPNRSQPTPKGISPVDHALVTCERCHGIVPRSHAYRVGNHDESLSYVCDDCHRFTSKP